MLEKLINFHCYTVLALLEESENTENDNPADIQVNMCYLLL